MNKTNETFEIMTLPRRIIPGEFAESFKEKGSRKTGEGPEDACGPGGSLLNGVGPELPSCKDI